MSKEWKNAEKAWDFGLMQTKMWINGGTVFYKMPGRQESSLLISNITDVVYKSFMNGKLEIFGSGTSLATITVPKNKQKVSNDFVDYMRSKITK